ncbi:MAG TPA: ATP-dependent sacrificial sulfur transferase LarE [Candidatus Acidoferrales bacterium]|nr:ATP-dependent sacrificial sulfur transferase LarE [Candidatus Acidoferrales bacterium]
MPKLILQKEQPLAPSNENLATALDLELAHRKQERLLAALRRLDSLLIAFSGGADSAYLAWAANQALGQRALAVTALSASFSEHDRREAAQFASAYGLRHEFIGTEEFENPLYVANNADRCYHCKDELFDRMESLAHERGFAAIAYGINADDTHEFRPGHRAAAEHEVLAPLLDAGLSKSEIRALSREAGLSTWDRPAAACLSSRVAYGTTVTPELLARIECGETFLRDLGFRQFRLRAHGDLARVEIAPDELPRALNAELAQRLANHLRSLGFTYVTLDLEGYRTGSLNALLKPRKL